MKIYHEITKELLFEGKKANLYGANLSGANLNRANLNWNSHNLLSEILKQNSSDEIDKLKIAGLIKIATHLCWLDFVKLNDPLMPWVKEVFSSWKNCPLNKLLEKKNEN